MRITLAALSLLITLASVGVDLAGPRSTSELCHLGFCRSEQLFATIDANGITAASLSPLLEQEASNPMVWCTYADALERQGRTAEAHAAFERAISLGPHMPPVFMRAANFAFTHGDRQRAWDLSRRILEQTNAFDGILFSYLRGATSASSELLGTAIPATPRAAEAWLSSLRSGGSDRAVLDTWAWMRRNGLSNRPSAVEAAWTLWERHSFQAAQQVWTDWIGPEAGDYTHPQELANRRFQTEPQGGPFDWSLDVPPSVVVARKDGLEVRFQGTENIAFNHVRQTAVARPGRYRFSAEIQADRLTSDQGPFFRIFDPVSPSFQVQTPSVEGTVARSWITAEFTVPPSTRAVLVQLERRPSERLDNKISGTLHIYQVSLLRVGSE